MSDSYILALSPRQTQIKLYELDELILQERVEKFIENGGDVNELPANSELARKYDEMRGIEWEDMNVKKVVLDDMDRRYIEALKKNPHFNMKEFLKNGK